MCEPKTKVYLSAFCNENGAYLVAKVICGGSCGRITEHIRSPNWPQGKEDPWIVKCPQCDTSNNLTGIEIEDR